MATENRGVMVYLPVDVEEYITNFCTEYSITRKDKEGNILPSLGTGVVTYLKSKISGESPDDILARPSKLPSNGLSKDEVLDLIREYNTSESPSNGLTKSEVLDLINECFTSHLSSAGLSNGLTKSEVLDLIASDRLSNSPLTVEAIAPKPARKPPEALDLNTATTASWGAFHQILGLDCPLSSQKSVELGAIATDRAEVMGFEGWTFDGKKQRFNRTIPLN